MKLVIRSISTWEYANIRLWEPQASDVIAETIYISIGPENKKGADIFSIRVATPKGLLNLDVKDGIIAVRPLLVIDQYDYDDLWSWIVKIVKKCESDTWNSSVEKLKLYFDWEYD